MDRTKAIALLTIAVALLTGCGGGNRIVVGSKNFTEQLILGEILAQQIERRLEVPVDRRLNLGGTLIAHRALVSGEIDLYPEYTGTALTAILDRPPENNPQEVFAKVRRQYESDFGSTWLPPLGFNNSFVMAIPGALARDHAFVSVSDAATYQMGWMLGVGYEFESRPDGLPALQAAYKLKLDGQPHTMELGLIYQAIEQGQVNMIAANGTDGLLSRMDLKVLEDDQNVFPPYEAAAIVRQDTLDQYPGLREALEELSGTLNAQTMRELNYQVDGEHKLPGDVAADFLAKLGQP